jgi:hypothetical protein
MTEHVADTFRALVARFGGFRLAPYRAAIVFPIGVGPLGTVSSVVHLQDLSHWGAPDVDAFSRLLTTLCRIPSRLPPGPGDGGGCPARTRRPTSPGTALLLPSS